MTPPGPTDDVPAVDSARRAGDGAGQVREHPRPEATVAAEGRDHRSDAIGPPLWSAAGAALEAAVREGSDIRFVADPGSGLAQSLVTGLPGRLVAASGPWSRLAIAAGVAASGALPVIVAEEAAPAPLPRELPGGLVPLLVTSRPAAARAWWAVGATTYLPAWPDDVAPLLATALSYGKPAVLVLHGRGAAGRPPAERELPLRPLGEGGAGLAVAAGRLAPVLAEVAGLQHGSPMAVRALQLAVVAPPPAPLPPDALEGAVLVGTDPAEDVTGPGGANLTRVPVPEAATARDLWDAILGALPLRSLQQRRRD